MSYIPNLYHYHSVWPKVVYCYFTKPTMYSELLLCWYHKRCRSLHRVSLLYTYRFQTYIAKCIVYCCFTRNALFTLHICVFMCIPCFILICCFRSELHAHLVPIVMYCIRLFTRTTMFTELFTCWYHQS